MVSRKRTRAEAEGNDPPNPSPSTEQGLLHQLRNTWEFANLMQYIFTFGKLVKISEDIDIDELETECLKPGPSEVLQDIGLSLLKFVSSHRALTRDNFEEYTRRQYYAKAPSRNPFGDDELPTKFNDFNIFQKLRVLHQLSVWTFWNPDRIRERMPEQKDAEQTQWRIEEIGYDRHDRSYYVLDDNRLYRRTDPPIPTPQPAKPKANSKRGRALARAAKKRKASESSAVKQEEDDNEEENEDNENDPSKGYKWECVAVTLDEYRAFVDPLQKTRDPNEKILRDSLLENVVPVIEQAAEAQQRKLQRREKELINLEKLAHAKRSSRIAGKQEKERQAVEAAEEERRLEAERIAAQKKEQMQEKIEKERLDRLMTREQRLKDREEKRKQQQEQLEAIEEQAQKMEASDSRVSERQLKVERAKREQDLAALQPEEDQWFFDCSGCGIHGENLDDGSHSVSCEKCNVWQHSQCLGIPQAEAERDDFHFVCKDCQRRIEEANRPKIPPLKFRVPKPSEPSQEPSNGEKRKHEQQQEPAPKRAKAAPPTPTQGQVAPVSNGAVPHAMPNPQSQPVPFQAQAPIGPTYGPTNANGPLPSLQPPPPMPNMPAYPAISQPQQTTSHVPSTPAAPAASPVPARQEQQKSPLKFIQHYGPGQAPPPNTGSPSFGLQRPPSQSKQSPSQSPIGNRPSMSPTQGNRDVGPLAGFPYSSQSNGHGPSTPFSSQSQSQSQSQNHPNSGSPYPVGPPPNQTPNASFSSTTTPQPTSSFGHSPPPPHHYSPSIAKSGLSPTKHSSPPPPPPFNSGVGNASVLPPIQKLQPSPKLMGRSSTDDPIPPPVKGMTPEQEDKRRRENMIAAEQLQYPQQLPPPRQEQHQPASNGQQ